MTEENLKYLFSLTEVPGVGSFVAKKLIAYIGSAEKVFKTPAKTLLTVPEVGPKVVEAIVHFKDFSKAEREIKFAENNGIEIITYSDPHYPQRLRECSDSPLWIFTKGNMNLETPKTIAFVGTRKATEYGKEMTKKLIEDIAVHRPLIISGLAYGIDIAAHREALALDLQTVGILGHGLDQIYPSTHTQIAQKMLKNGGIISEFFSGGLPDKENFPKRNRIIAGLCDAVVVVEAAEKGGALITAKIANTYNRDVFAVPGRVIDEFSKGCNYLIRTNQAAVIESGADIEYILGWKKQSKKKNTQRQLLIDLPPEEERVVNMLKDKESVAWDELTYMEDFTPSMLSSALLNLEMKGIVGTMPGKRFKLI